MKTRDHGGGRVDQQQLPHLAHGGGPSSPLERTVGRYTSALISACPPGVVPLGPAPNPQRGPCCLQVRMGWYAGAPSTAPRG